MSEAHKKVRIRSLMKACREGRKITVVTAYDAITARWADEAGVDIILVGDSLGNTALGMENTIGVTLEAMIHHTAAVMRVVKSSFVVADLPFMTYKISPEQAMAAATRLMQEGGAEAVKLEGGAWLAPTIERLTTAGVPVMAHIGLLPQSFHAESGYRVHGRGEDAERLLADALAVEAAGAFSVVLEVVAASASKRISDALAVPSIGIGAGPNCDGQVLVTSDMLGMIEGETYRHVKRYGNLAAEARRGLSEYIEDVRAGRFPSGENCFND